MTKKKTFEPVSSRVDFVALEKKILKEWDSSGLVEKYLKRNARAKKHFSFIDGPITANNPMGVHHAWGRTLKDFFQRYKNMQGHQQRFQNGFDCQGLWVEVEVEKDAGFNSKKDIEKFGVAEFTNACKARVNKFARIQTEQSKRLGMFMDWDNSYFTNSETNNLYIWHFLKIVQQKGWLYKDKSSATWCPRCETGLSQHEQADGYQQIKDLSVYIKFKLKNPKNEYLLVWTTTPWTLAANVLLAINTNFDYVQVKQDGQTWYLAKDSARRLGFKEVKDFDGKKLLGLEYDSLFDFPAQKGIKHRIVEWDLVDPVEGTGVVHVAPGCGPEDYELGKKLGVAKLSPLDERGHFGQGYDWLTGQYAHDTADQIVKRLRQQGMFYKTEALTHRYPHCWRCGTKCLFRLEDDWFINCSKLKPRLKRLAHQAKWRPEFAGKRMQNWLDNMGDWMISRKRYYGLALPFYECDCGQLTVVGSKEELKKLAVDPKKVDQLPSLHRPWIDEVLIKCPGCGQPVKRIPDVGDCWLDAGVVPFSTLKYFEDKTYWQKWFPAELICEMIEQIRLWYYSMLVYSAVFENQVPYLNVSNYMEVRDEKGQRISKSKKTNIPFDQGVEKMGADVMRWLYLSQNLSQNLNFGFKVGDETRRQFHLILWNVYNFLVTYANVDRWQPNKKTSRSKNVLDCWLISRLNQTIKEVTACLDDYDTFHATQLLADLVNDLSVWYLRRSRTRVGPTAVDKADKNNCYTTLWFVLVTLAKVLAPFVPFISEEIFKNLTNRESVHLQDWPQPGPADQALLEKMAWVRQIVERGHSQRKQAGIKVRQPLASLEVKGVSKELEPALVELIKDELNLKQIVFKPGKGRLKVRLDSRLTPALKAEGKARGLVRQIQQLRKEAGCRLDQRIVVFGPHLPKDKNLIDYLKKQTLASQLEPGKRLRIKPLP